MRTGLGSIVLGAAALLVIGSASAQTPGDDYPYQGRAGYTLDATVNQVDADRDRVIVSGDDGHTYTLDTYQAAIKLRVTDRAGETGDLVPGMRLHIVGTLVSSELIETDRVSVLPYRPMRPTVRRVTSPPDTSSPHRRDQALTGRISQESTYFSRDIKVRLNPDVEVTVHVPKNIPIRSDGQAISVHDLHKDEFVRVSGAYDGDAFKASRIEVTGDHGD